MGKGIYTDADGMLQTDAEAVIFAAYAIKKGVGGGEYLQSRLLMVQGNEVKIFGIRSSATNIVPGVRAMEKAIEKIVFRFCGRSKLKYVDIVYALDDDVFTDRVICEYYKPMQDSSGMRVVDVISQDVKVRLHRRDMLKIDTNRLLNAIFMGCDGKWLKEQDAVEAFLAIAKRCAESREEEKAEHDAYSFENLSWIAQEFAHQNPIQVQPWVPADDGSDLYDAYNADDDSDPYGAYDAPADGGCQQPLIDLLYKYAESIKKNKMTSFHLLYGLACICLMRVQDICEELGGTEEFYTRISYLQGKCFI